MTPKVSEQKPDDPDFSDVPAADPTAELDPNFMTLRGSDNLPASYLPPSMAGPSRTWQRAVALSLIGVFLLATAAGVCLTYGAPGF